MTPVVEKLLDFLTHIFKNKKKHKNVNEPLCSNMVKHNNACPNIHIMVITLTI